MDLAHVFWMVIAALSVVAGGTLLFLFFGAKSESDWHYGAPWPVEHETRSEKTFKCIPFRTPEPVRMPLKRLKTH